MNRYLIISKNALQRGFSLIELMVAMTIGLVLLGALAYFFLGSQQMNRSHDDVSRMQESGRNALESMGGVIRRAGYQNDTNLIAGVALALTSLDGTDGASGAPDTITVQYEAQNGGEPDCTGTNIAAGAVITQVFAIVPATATTPPTLTCNGGVIVDNIEDMQISYGIDLGKTGSISAYETSPAANEFAGTAAVRISLLVKGPVANVATNNSQTYVYNGASVTKTDGFLRQVYTSTFTVRSQAR
ncbi:MAG: PilW family protein [Undibacterium sp.]|uniref:PilW family protein n=1 Tax=Undibacterium sp. TaxID=1914977 RepID=UPI00271FA236|nr:PilW family protein [Undibacterium sp.]MDO8651302.1 PilW family protein [Undibacterium sp.]